MTRTCKLMPMLLSTLLIGPLLMAGCPLAALDDLVSPPTVDTGVPEEPVRTTNNPPTTNAGPDQTTVAGSLIVLNGSASKDSDGDRLAFIWQQVDGEPTVELDGQFSSFARFSAPKGITASTTLTFRLTTVDGFAATEDDVVVTITPDEQ